MSTTLAAAGNSGVPIAIRHVSKVFGEDTEKPFLALKPVNISIAAGEFISVVGASGCGKSTLMLMVAGLLKQTTGEVRVGDAAVTRPITDVGIAFQDHLLLDFRTAFENVMLHADIRRLPRPRIERRAKELFAQLRLDHAMHKYPIQLSGGMRQRVSLIRTLVHDPSVLLMDERFGALDALTRLQVRSDLEALWLRRRPTVLFITHSVEEAEPRHGGRRNKGGAAAPTTPRARRRAGVRRLRQPDLPPFRTTRCAAWGSRRGSPQK